MPKVALMAGDQPAAEPDAVQALQDAAQQQPRKHKQRARHKKAAQQKRSMANGDSAAGQERPSVGVGEQPSRQRGAAGSAEAAAADGTGAAGKVDHAEEAAGDTTVIDGAAADTVSEAAAEAVITDGKAMPTEAAAVGEDQAAVSAQQASPFGERRPCWDLP